MGSFCYLFVYLEINYSDLFYYLCQSPSVNLTLIMYINATTTKKKIEFMKYSKDNNDITY